MELTACHPSTAQNIELADRFLKKLWASGYFEHSCEHSALETAGSLLEIGAC